MDSFYIALCGAASSGKTTLGNALTKYFEDRGKSVYHITNISRKLAEQGFPINEKATVDTQLRITMTYWLEEIKNSDKVDVIVSDRSYIDQYAHAIVNDKLPKSTLIWYRSFMPVAISRYNMIVYLPQEFDMVADGVRNIDKDYQKKIADIMLDLFNEYSHGLIVKGTVEERLAQVTKELPEYLTEKGR